MGDRRGHHSSCRRLRRCCWKSHFVKTEKVLIVATVLLVQLACFFFFLWYSQTIPYGRKYAAVDAEGERIIIPGETEPSTANALPGLTTTLQTYTTEELEEKYANMDFIYAFVNGTEANHAYRRAFVHKCGPMIQKLEEEYYLNKDSAASICSVGDRLSEEDTNAELLLAVDEALSSTISHRDSEHGELRYSIRSVEEHMRWHTGRLIIVSPGHHPSWINRANNFMLSACTSNHRKELRGRHNRITTVHQDAIMPYGLRLTMDSHVIEMQLFRLRNITPIHLYLNDDYFINRDAEVTDLLNVFGGTYVRTERSMLQKAIQGDSSRSWLGSVWHTNLFNVHELDLNSYSHLPPKLITRWKDAGYDFRKKISVPGTETYVHTARHYEPEILPKKVTPARPRFFATHAPFVYCTRMFEYINTRYEREIAHHALTNRIRRANDFLTPFVYNAFIMTRPWQSSPRFLPYLASLRISNESNDKPPPPLDIVLDNEDGCAPATLLRKPAAETTYLRFVDNLERNKESIHKLKEANPLFFNVNDGFSSSNSSVQLQDFLASLFVEPVHVERTKGSNAQEGYDNVYVSLMKLPIVIFASYTEAFCPLVRSLQLTLPDHEGVIVLVRDSQLDKEDEIDDLSGVRKRLNHRVINGMPVTYCTYNSKVKHITLKEWRGLDREIVDAIESIASIEMLSVPLPGDYIGGANMHAAAMVIDARTQHPLDTVQAVSHAIEVPAQTIALEDFVPLSLSKTGVFALVLALQDAERKAVHWVYGASEADLLLAFPLPVATYEDLLANVRWSLEEN